MFTDLFTLKEEGQGKKWTGPRSSGRSYRAEVVVGESLLTRPCPECQ